VNAVSSTASGAAPQIKGKQVLAQTESRALTAQYPSIRDKRVIVTGGASGIGEGIVEAFVLQGAQVGFVDILPEAGERLVQRLGHAEHVPVFRAQDVSDSDGLAGAMTALADALGGCDVLINNAASDDRHMLDDVTPAYWDERLAVNLKHKFFASQAVWPGMKASGGGVILNLGSISWHLGLDELALYQIAKAGVEGLTRSLARELGPYNIRVNTIIPGNVQTERQMRWYTPEGEAEIVAAQCLKGRLQPVDIAAMALFLASDDARFCTGHEYWVDGGWR
jgi:NAD(P)-dependent dehydrogenase (short-subunit alcohol dehydrogenase family)